MKVIMNMEINKNMKEKYYYLVNAVYIAKNFRVEYSYVAYTNILNIIKVIQERKEMEIKIRNIIIVILM